MSGTPSPAAVGAGEQEPRCWCCGATKPPAQLLRLNSHPEVELCLGCARFLAKRAAERRDQMRPTRAGRLRDVLRAGRRLVVDHGWQQAPVIGPILRWIGRFTP